MKAETLTYLIMVLFLIHEFEEMIMISPWVRRQIYQGSERTRKHYFVQRFAGASQAVIVFMISIEFIVLSVVTAISLITDWYSLMIGFLIPYVLHLIGHVTEWFVYRSYTPSLVTSVLTLLPCIGVGYTLYTVSGATPIGVGVSIALMTALFAINFGFIIIIEPKAKQWFKRYEQSD